MEITRVLTNGTTVTTAAEPTDVDGLAIAPVLVSPSADSEETDPIVASDQWVVVHVASGRPVIQLPMPQRIARRFAELIGGVDWTVAREEIREADPRTSEHLRTVREALGAVQEFIGLTDAEFAEAENEEAA